MTEDDDFEQWSDEARESYLDASAALQAALASHVSTVSAARDAGDLAAVLAANDALDVAASAYADAQSVLTGTFPAFEVDEEYVDDEDDDLDDTPATAVMVLSRVVYAVTSEDEIIDAGRRAYRRVSPAEERDLAEVDVTDLARAFHLIAEDTGWEALDSTEGLRRRGRTTWIASTPTPSKQSLDDPHATPFELEEGTVLLYRVDEVR